VPPGTNDAHVRELPCAQMRSTAFLFTCGSNALLCSKPCHLAHVKSARNTGLPLGDE
jgi:hypothetical protein